MIEIIKLILRTPVPTLIFISGIYFLLISIGVHFKLTFKEEGPREKEARIIGFALVFVGITLNILFIILFPPPPEENCKFILPIITSPASNSEVSSPVYLKGKVNNVPQKHGLWIMVYNQNLRKFCDCVDIVPSINNVWERKISLTCGKVGDDYDIYLCLADLKSSAELQQYRSKQSGTIPEIVKKCHLITVNLKQ